MNTLLTPEVQEIDDSPWQKSSVANLVRWKASNVYFARVKINGRLIRKSLKTTLLSVAKNRLAELIQEERTRAEGTERTFQGKLTFNELLDLYRHKLDGDAELKPSTKKYRRECIAAIVKTWPGLKSMDARKVTKAACHKWAVSFRQEGTRFRAPGTQKERKGISPTRFNGTVTTLRQIMSIAVDMGLTYVNPTTDIKRARERTKELTLPSRQQFIEFVKQIESSGAAQAKDSADFVRFLAFSGCRISEAHRVCWQDVDWEKGELVIRGDPETGTKNWEIRRTPMIPELRDLLNNVRATRSRESWATPVLRVKECQGSMNRAARLVGMPRITHHDLRHLYATTAIESGIDIPTVSRLLGHKDGGALAMKVYGHLRQEHAKAAVQKIRFGLAPSSSAVTFEI